MFAQIWTRGFRGCWSSRIEPARSLLLVADGLGHGPAAASASTAAIERVSGAALSGSPQAIIEKEDHGALKSTRGAALAISEIDF